MYFKVNKHKAKTIYKSYYLKSDKFFLSGIFKTVFETSIDKTL